MNPLRSVFPKKKPKKVLFLASGRGSNFQASLQFLKQKPHIAEPLGLICDNPTAQAISLAKSEGLPVHILDFSKFSPKSSYHSALLDLAQELSPDLVVACGYMRILKPDFIAQFRNKILNVHPSLLPAFPGLDAQKQALEYGAKVSGCTIHFVEEGVDTGPIILQKAIEISEQMTEKELSIQILKEEHRLLPLAIQYFCEDKLEILGRKVRIKK